MQPLGDERLLEIWENRGARDDDVGGDLLRAALPSSDLESLDDWPLALRQATLLRLRCATFGATLRAAMDCPQCADRLEFELDGRELLRLPGADSPAHTDAAPSEAAFEVRGMRFRLPTGRDLAALREIGDERAAVERIANRCCLDSPAPTVWPEELIAEVDERLERMDPLGSLQLALECPGCHSVWDQAFDIGRYFWEEVELRAKTILAQVHRLARGYGWSEKEVLALSVARRRAYLELLSA
jgi:hypothetical protein